jgi:hypothetical protein
VWSFKHKVEEVLIQFEKEGRRLKALKWEEVILAIESNTHSKTVPKSSKESVYFK